MAEEARDRSHWLVIAAVIIATSSLLCCSCLALAWIFGDTAMEFMDQYSDFARSLL